MFWHTETVTLQSYTNQEHRVSNRLHILVLDPVVVSLVRAGCTTPQVQKFYC